MDKCTKQIASWVITLLCLLLYTQPALAADKQYDVKILIDVSGSMKKNDPKDLRRSATKLILGLLPPNSRAGVWTFGTKTQNIVPYNKTNKAWRQRAIKQLKQIHSRSAFTDIDDALTISAADWSDNSSDDKRIIILLTDGLVDISRNKNINENSRKKILKQTLNMLQQKNVHVYTIALSEFADHPLLQQLARATEGQYKKALSATELQQAFLQMFDAAVKRDGVPIKDGGIQVDKSIKEITLMLLHDKSTSTAALLVDPAGRRYKANTRHPDIHWQHETTYDLITITKPMPGTWHLKTDEMKNSRAYIVSKLKLRSSDIPGLIFFHEKIAFNASLEHNGKVIRNGQFLDLLNISLEQLTASNKQFVGRYSLSRSQQGDYSAHLVAPDFGQGQFYLVLNVSGEGFARTMQQLVTVHDTPVKIDLTPSRQDLNYKITVEPDPKWMLPHTLSVKAAIVDSRNHLTPLGVISQKANTQIVAIDGKTATKQRYLELTIRGKAISGRSFVIKPPRINIAPMVKPKPVIKKIPKAKPVVAKPVVIKAPKPVTKPKVVVAPKPKPVVATKVVASASSDKLSTALKWMVMIGTIVIMSLLAYIIRLLLILRRNNQITVIKGIIE